MQNDTADSVVEDRSIDRGLRLTPNMWSELFEQKIPGDLEDDVGHEAEGQCEYLMKFTSEGSYEQYKQSNIVLVALQA